MDAFFVSVEVLRRPELRGKPVVVGSSGSRGVVAAASYEARRHGVFSAMASVTARRLCPDAVFIPADHGRYLEVSESLMDIFHRYTPLVEPISVDEAFLDVTGSTRLLGAPIAIARSLRATVLDETGLTCSVGLAGNKFLAKLGSEHAKPRATPLGVEPGHQVFEVAHGSERAFLAPLPVGELWGVGPATLAKLERLGIRRVADIAALDVSMLVTALGEAHGRHLHELARGIDDRPVVPDRAMKSIGHEETFDTDKFTREELRPELVRLSDAVARRVRRAGVAAATVSLKVKFSSFHTITRSVTPRVPLTSGPAIVAALWPLLEDVDVGQGVRLLGVYAQRLGEPSSDVGLFEGMGSARAGIDSGSGHDPGAVEGQWSATSAALDEIVDRYGRGAIGPASSLGEPAPGESPWGREAPGHGEQ